MQRRTLLTLPLAALAGCARKTELTTIRVLSRPQFQMSGLYLAQERGYFAKEGIEIAISPSEGSRTMIPLLSEGQADVGFSGIAAGVVNAFTRGAQFRLVAGRGMYSPECPDNRRVYGSRAAFPMGFATLSQMRGKRVAYGGALTLGEYVWDRALHSAGLKPTDVTLVQVDDRQAAVMVAAGQVDVAFNAADEIRFTSLINEVVPGPSFTEFIPEFMYSFIYYGRDLLRGTPDRGIRFLRAFLRGQAEFAEGANPKYFLDYMHENKMNEKILTICRKEYRADGYILMKDLQDQIDWAVQRGYSPARVMAEDLIDRRFLDGLKRA